MNLNSVCGNQPSYRQIVSGRGSSFDVTLVPPYLLMIYYLFRPTLFESNTIFKLIAALDNAIISVLSITI